MDLKKFTSFAEFSIRDLNTVKEAGGKVAGVYCVYAPFELIRAAGAVPVSLCGKKQDPIKDAEKELPASLCPLIKASYGYAITDTCPFFTFADVIVAETTCDGKKKMYELMEKIKPLHLMHLPHTQEGKAALNYWKEGLKELEDFLFEYTGVRVTEEALRREIVEHNKIRVKVQEICLLAARPDSPLSASDLLAIQESRSFIVNSADYLASLDQLKADLDAHYAKGETVQRRTRVLLTGCPTGKGSDKVINLLEELGSQVVYMENCVGLKGNTLMVDETIDPYQAIAERYLKIPCSCMTPNPGRPESIAEMVTTFGVDAIVDLTWIGCHTYNAESTVLRRFVEDELELPFFQVETDYSSADEEQLRTRLEALLELVA